MALCTFHRGTVRVKNMNLNFGFRCIFTKMYIALWFVSPILKKKFSSLRFGLVYYDENLGIASNLTLKKKGINRTQYYRMILIFFRLTVKAMCQMELQNYPLDSQICDLQIGSCK